MCFVIGVMDVAANGLEKTSAVEQEAMVSKLHNMQWLKKASHSTSSYVYSLAQFLCYSILITYF